MVYVRQAFRAVYVPGNQCGSSPYDHMAIGTQDGLHLHDRLNRRPFNLENRLLIRQTLQATEILYISSTSELSLLR